MSLFCCLCADVRRPADPQVLQAIGRACSPRVERYGTQGVVFDVSGLARVLGPPAAIAAEIRRLTIDRGVSARMAVAGTMMAAWLLAHTSSAEADRIVVPGDPAAALTGVEIGLLATLPDAALWGRAEEGRRGRRPRQAPDSRVECLAALRRWGLRTLGDLARLPAAEVRTRLGEMGLRLHRAAHGLDAAPLVPTAEPARFIERLELEWPIEGLEPLSFVLARLCDPLSTALERADRGAVTVITRLRLVTRATYQRTLHWPAPIRDARVLRTLILLDLESHPPTAAIDVVELELGVTPGRIVQGSLLARSLPSPEHLTTLVARLGALMGETRVGAPVLLDTCDERVVRMNSFAPERDREPRDPGRGEPAGAAGISPAAPPLGLCLRRFRLPIAATVVVEHGAPVQVTPACGLPGGRIVVRAGPWRSSGRWWAPVSPLASAEAWDRDEWDVELAGPGGVFCLARDRATGRWEVQGVFD